MRKINFEKNVYSDGGAGIFVTWEDAETFLGRPHDGSCEDDETLIQGLIDSGAPEWVGDSHGWIDELGWGLIGPETIDDSQG